MAEDANSPFTEEERRSFYLETLGDAHCEGLMLHEPFWWARSRFPAATDRQREALAEWALTELLDKGFIELFEMGSEVPLDSDPARQIICGETWRTAPPAPIFEFASTPLGDKAMDDVPKEVWSGLWGQKNPKA